MSSGRAWSAATATHLLCIKCVVVLHGEDRYLPRGWSSLRVHRGDTEPGLGVAVTMSLCTDLRVPSLLKGLGNTSRGRGSRVTTVVQSHRAKLIDMATCTRVAAPYGMLQILISACILRLARTVAW